MKKTLKEKVIVITGASSGIGEAMARVYAAQGARVVLGADGLAPTDRGTLDVSSMTKAGTINPVFSPGEP